MTFEILMSILIENSRYLTKQITIMKKNKILKIRHKLMLIQNNYENN